MSDPEEIQRYNAETGEWEIYSRHPLEPEWSVKASWIDLPLAEKLEPILFYFVMFWVIVAFALFSNWFNPILFNYLFG